MRALRVVLIGGTSNVGKSTLARALAGRLGWSCVSTDRLGRHPGRPWRTDGEPIPAHVASHYRSLTAEDLTAEQLRHYERMWPAIASLVEAHAFRDGADRLIVEGSGVWPDRVVQLNIPKVAAIWLTASPETLRTRIHAASRYAGQTDEQRGLIDNFIGRTDQYNQMMLASVRRLGLASIDVDSLPSPDALVDQCLQLLD